MEPEGVGVEAVGALEQQQQLRGVGTVDVAGDDGQVGAGVGLAQTLRKFDAMVDLGDAEHQVLDVQRQLKDVAARVQHGRVRIKDRERVAPVRVGRVLYAPHILCLGRKHHEPTSLKAKQLRIDRHTMRGLCGHLNILCVRVVFILCFILLVFFILCYVLHVFFILCYALHVFLFYVMFCMLCFKFFVKHTQ